MKTFDEKGALVINMGKGGGGGSGNVTGPDSSVDKDIVIFDGETGDKIKDSGKKIADLIEKSIGEEKGDIIVFTANKEPKRLKIGQNGEVLTVDNTKPEGVKWAAGGGGGGSKFASFKYQAGAFDIPNNADWKVNAYPGIGADSTYYALTVHPFDDTTEEGVGFQFRVPTGAQKVTIRITSKPKTAPTGEASVIPKIYVRKIGNNNDMGEWSNGYELEAITFGANTFFIQKVQVLQLNQLSLAPDGFYQFELTRNTYSEADSLVGDWCLLEVEFNFS